MRANIITSSLLLLLTENILSVYANTVDIPPRLDDLEFKKPLYEEDEEYESEPYMEVQREHWAGTENLKRVEYYTYDNFKPIRLTVIDHDEKGRRTESRGYRLPERKLAKETSYMPLPNGQLRRGLVKYFDKSGSLEFETRLDYFEGGETKSSETTRFKNGTAVEKESADFDLLGRTVRKRLFKLPSGSLKVEEMFLPGPDREMHIARVRHFRLDGGIDREVIYLRQPDGRVKNMVITDFGKKARHLRTVFHYDADARKEGHTIIQLPGDSILHDAVYVQS